MATNVTIFPVDGPAVIYFQDGTSMVAEEQVEKSFQIIDGGFCTISDAPDDVDEDGQPGEKFFEMMVAFWNKLWDEVSEEVRDPEVNPL